MPAVRLTARAISKPWGRARLWPGFDDVPAGGEAIGEIWYEGSGAAHDALLVKYLFTSERLSIQVHPNDAAAQAAGHVCGKDEAWLILDAEPGATIALGLRERVSRAALHAAALDGSITDLMHWQPIKPGDFIYSPAGTVHAIGAGITLIEVQQNVDLTYRLYDYGRPRALHLREGIAVSAPVPFERGPPPPPTGDARRSILCEGGKFVVERLSAGARRTLSGSAWLVPIAGTGCVDGEAVAAGECWQIGGRSVIDVEAGGDMLLAYEGGAVRD